MLLILSATKMGIRNVFITKELSIVSEQECLSEFIRVTFIFWTCLCLSHDGAGQQCCYDLNGYLMMTSDNKWGGTPMRSHNLGVLPWNEAAKIPTMSHWLQDISPFYPCCMWQDEQSGGCQTYRFERRPSQDCVGYLPPGGGRGCTMNYHQFSILIPQQLFLVTLMCTHLTTKRTRSMAWVNMSWSEPTLPGLNWMFKEDLNR